MRGLGDVLQRIEASVSNAQQQWQDDKQASRINPIALTSVLISIISILVGGAWLVSGSLARQDERSVQQQRISIAWSSASGCCTRGVLGGSAPEANTQ
jgi:cell division protein FtsB